MIQTMTDSGQTVQKKADFYSTLRKRVDDYFTSNHLSKYATPGVKAKIALLFVTLFGSLTLILFITNPWLSIACWAVLGFSTALIGMNVAHDSLHGSLSSNHKLNEAMGLSLSLLGGNAYLWKIMHNQVHHTFTNVQNVDDDLEAVPGVRMHPGKPLRFFNRFQHIYVWPMYGLATISWVFLKDFRKMFAPQVGHVKRSQHPKKEIFLMFLFKVLYLGLFLALPLAIAPVSIGWVISGFVLSHFIAGMTLGVIFQLAHCVEGPEFPEAGSGKSVLKMGFAEHQLHTTANFATQSPVMNFVCGGLNFQVEHHLFPKVSYGHYKAISKIVKQTAHEFGVPYIEQPSFWYAVRSHYRLLRKFGREEHPVVMPAVSLG